MTPEEALAALGIAAPCTLDDARAAFRSRVREHHPDIAGEASTARAANITQAYALLRNLAAAGDGTTIDPPRPTGPQPGRRSGAAAATPSAPAGTPRRPTPYEEAIAAEIAEGDTVFVHAPPNETFGLLFEAASHVGHIGYFDRDLGILETIVRFEGGPSCSVLSTLQGRANGTDVFCTMDSLEATPPPPIRPVVEALVDALRSL